jgi:hypothetical protein
MKADLGDIVADGRIILKCILEKEGVNVRTGFNWLRQVPMSGLYI